MNPAEINWRRRNKTIANPRGVRKNIQLKTTIKINAIKNPKNGENTIAFNTLTSPPICKTSTPPCINPAPIIPPIKACDELEGKPILSVMKFQMMAPPNADMITTSFTAPGSIIPLPTIFATAVDIKAPTTFRTPAITTAVTGLSTRVGDYRRHRVGTIMPSVRKIKQQSQDNNQQQ